MIWREVLISRTYRIHTENNCVSAEDVLKAIICVWKTFVLSNIIYVKVHYHNEKSIIRAKYLAFFDDRAAVIVPNFEFTVVVDVSFCTMRYEFNASFDNKKADQTDLDYNKHYHNKSDTKLLNRVDTRSNTSQFVRVTSYCTTVRVINYQILYRVKQKSVPIEIYWLT
jgi:hypothetical protein